VSAPWEGLAEEGSPAAKALEAIAKASPDFHGPTFAEGAKRAYEMILSAYAAGDKQALKPLLGRDVAETFFRSIDSRARDGASVVFQFVGVNKVTVERAALEGRTASITLRFRSDMIHALRDKSGETIEGDARAVRDVEDIWTFERDTSSRDPNWRLVATDDDIG
jgi:predicted lipid-binding transport protein (Tim44 family)